MKKTLLIMTLHIIIYLLKKKFLMKLKKKISQLNKLIWTNQNKELKRS